MKRQNRIPSRLRQPDRARLRDAGRGEEARSRITAVTGNPAIFSMYQAGKTIWAENEAELTLAQKEAATNRELYNFIR